MSQVKNLRAMFENKGDTSPPDRGRSPGVISSSHIGGTNSSGSPRPLSRVRTNFIAIERDGRMGLRRDHSDEPSLTTRRLSTDTADTESNCAFSEKSITASLDDAAKAARRTITSETIPESPITMSHEQQACEITGLETQMKRTIIEPINKTDKSLPPVERGGTDLKRNLDPKPVAPTHRSHGINDDVQPVSLIKIAMAAPKKGTGVVSVARPESKAKVREQRTNKPSVDKPQEGSIETQLSTKARTVPSAQVQLLKGQTQKDRGFVKPKPKSPTRPVHLPPSLTAPTASSVSKVHQSVARQVGGQNSPAQNSLRAISPSCMVSQSTARRQGSSILRSRPSLGPPPSKQPHPAASQSRQSNVDEGFLARMMRPTQSSSSKTTDKAASLTPPRKTAQRPVVGGYGSKALSRSSSSRGFHSPKVIASAASKSNQIGQTDLAEENTNLKHGDEDDKPHLNTRNRVQSTADASKTFNMELPETILRNEASSDAVAKQPVGPEDTSTVPQELDLLRAKTSSLDPDTDPVTGEFAFDTDRVEKQAGITTPTATDVETGLKVLALGDTTVQDEQPWTHEKPEAAVPFASTEHSESKTSELTEDRYESVLAIGDGPATAGVIPSRSSNDSQSGQHTVDGSNLQIRIENGKENNMHQQKESGGNDLTPNAADTRPFRSSSQASCEETEAGGLDRFAKEDVITEKPPARPIISIDLEEEDL